MVLHLLLPRISGVFGVKKFFKFLQKEGFGADFHPSKQLQSGSESSFTLSPTHFVSQIFLKIFSCAASRQPDDRAVRSSDSQSSPAATPPKQPPRERSQDPLPTPPKTKNPETAKTGGNKKPETTKKPRGEPRGFSGAVDET